MKKAEKALNQWSLFQSSSAKYEKAQECYEKAVTQYKANGCFEKAGHAMESVASMAEKLASDRLENFLGKHYEDAAKCYENANLPEKSKLMYIKAAEIYQRGGKRAGPAFEQAAGQASDLTERKELLMRAYNSHLQQSSKVSAALALRKLALCEVESHGFDNAMELFDQLGREALDDSTTRSGAFRILFLALLANLAQLGSWHQSHPGSGSKRDILDRLAQRFQLYQQLDSQFNQHCREHMLITALLQALEGGDAEAYDAAVKSYRSVCPLEKPLQLMLDEGKGGLALGATVL